MNDRTEYYVDSYGMPPKLAEGLAMLARLWPNHDGPAHIVVADYNLEDHLIEACIRGCGPGENPLCNDYDSTDYPVYAATAAVLQWILDNVTEAERTVWMRTYE